jgi:hypothetical protein
MSMGKKAVNRLIRSRRDRRLLGIFLGYESTDSFWFIKPIWVETFMRRKPIGAVMILGVDLLSNLIGFSWSEKGSAEIHWRICYTMVLIHCQELCKRRRAEMHVMFKLVNAFWSSLPILVILCWKSRHFGLGKFQRSLQRIGELLSKRKILWLINSNQKLRDIPSDTDCLSPVRWNSVWRKVSLPL